MACYFRFLLDVDAPLAPPGYGCPSCGFYGPTPGGWIDALDGCPGCGYGAASKEEIKIAYHESQMTNFCFHCSTSYGGEYCPKCYADLEQQAFESQLEHERELENRRRTKGEDDIPF